MTVVCGGREFELNAITVSQSTLCYYNKYPRQRGRRKRLYVFSFNFRSSSPGFYCTGLVAGSFSESRRGTKPLLKNNKKIKTKEQTKYLHGYNVTESKRKTPGSYNLIESKFLMA